MPSITALLHTCNDALRLGRALETLHPVDEILIIDHASTDATLQVARNYGARIVQAEKGRQAASYLNLVRHDSILCLDPRESLTEALAASLFECKLASPSQTSSHALPACSVFLREETSTGWLNLPNPQTRIVPRAWFRWHDRLPITDPSASILEGALLRFHLP